MWTKHNNLTPSSTPQMHQAVRPNAILRSSSKVIIIIVSRLRITYLAKQPSSGVMIRGSLGKSTVLVICYTTIKVLVILRTSSPKCYIQAPLKSSYPRMAVSFLMMLHG